MSKKTIKTLIVWGIIIAIVVTAVILLITVVNKKEELPEFQIDGTTLVQYNGKEDGDEENVVIPKEVKMIGKAAFKNNSKIKTVTFEKGSQIEKIAMNAFESCPVLEEIVLPDSIIEIGDNAFLDCVGLIDITLPSNMISLGKSAFEGCISLLNITFNEGLQIIGDDCFQDCLLLPLVTLPSTLTTFGNDVFKGATSLTDIYLSAGNTSFTVDKDNKILYTDGGKELVVSARTAVTDLVIPNTVTKIRSNAFYNASSVVTLNVPTSVKLIEADAFSGCSSVEAVVLPFIGESLEISARFASVFGTVSDALKNITILQGSKVIEKAFNGLKQVEEIILPANSITYIGESAFDGCVALKNIVNLPNNLNIIRDYTFRDCSSLKADVLVNLINPNLQVIGKSAFEECKLLKQIKLPSSVKNIGIGAFAGCTGLNEIELPFIGMGYEYTEKNGQFTFSSTLNTTKIFGYIFSTNEITNNDGLSIGALKTVTITGDYDIVDKAFLNCKSITTLNLNNDVEKIGNQAFMGCTSLVTFVLPENVSAIGSHAFDSCTKLTTITNFPAKLTNLNDGLFYNCSKLGDIYISENIQAIGKNVFYNSTAKLSISDANAKFSMKDNSLYKADEAGTNKLHTLLYYQPATESSTTFTIPSETRVVAGGAFSNAKTLKEIVFPATVVEIQQHAIVNCSNITHLTLPFIGNVSEDNTEITRDARFNCIFVGTEPSKLSLTISNGETVANGAFSNNSNIQSITLSDTFTRIEASAFEKCSALEEVNFGTEERPAKITYIGSSAFAGCTKLQSIVLADTIIEIGDQAFAECSAINTITLPKNLEILGEGVFMNCSALTSINISDENTHFEVIDNGTILLTEDKSTLIVYIAKDTEYQLHDYITRIYSYAFSGLTNLTKVVLHNNVEEIGDGLFFNCKALTTVTLPESITKINNKMFEDCISLTTINNVANITVLEPSAFRNCQVFNQSSILDKVTEIGAYAFEDCKALTKVTLNEAITSIAVGTFKNCEQLSEVVYSDNIEIISDSAFENCAKLTSYKLPSKLKSIGKFAFSNATKDASLQDMNIIIMLPNGLETIGERAFYLALRIDVVYIPETVTTISYQGMEIGAGTQIFTDAYTFTDTKDEEGEVTRSYNYPKGWDSFRNIPCKIYCKGEFEWVDGLPTVPQVEEED